MLKHITDEEFEKEVINSKEICVVDFYATWCGPCMRLAPILEEISISRIKCNILKVDVDQNKETASKLNIDTIPTICIYKNGKLVDKKIGYMPKEELIEFIEKNS